MSRDLSAQFQREQLHDLAQEGDLARIEELLRRKHPVDCFDTLGKTPLHYAVRAEHFDVVDRLLRAGANVNANDEGRIGNTPLSDNVGTCSFAMVKRLIDAGADPTIRGWMQLTALDRAKKRADAEGERILRLLNETAARSRK